MAKKNYFAQQSEPFVVRVGPGETVVQALNRVGITTNQDGVIVIPPGTYIMGPETKKTRIIDPTQNNKHTTSVQ